MDRASGPVGVPEKGQGRTGVHGVGAPLGPAGGGDGAVLDGKDDGEGGYDRQHCPVAVGTNQELGKRSGGGLWGLWGW